MAVIESLAAEWEPERYSDCYRVRLERVVDQKKKGKRVSAPSEPKEPKPAPDLMAALRETLDRMGSGPAKLEQLSREELYERAQEEDVPGRSKMSKDELVEALS